MTNIFNLLPPLLRGAGMTVQVTAGAIALCVPASSIAALARLSRNPLIAWASRCYIEVFRGTSAMVQLFWVFYVLPFFHVDISPIGSAILVLGFNGGAYGAEIIRGAIRAIPRGQLDAAVALNLPMVRRVTGVMIPQALPRIVPPMANLFIDILKNSALAGLVTVSDLTFQAQVLRESTLANGEVYGLVIVIYFLLAIVLSLLMRFIERRVHFPVGSRA